ncbi:hypothetical protein ABWL39_15155 [Chitinivorax sp. PXF-14]|uniref:hypothetical protein n=1 Tax=Chitinivorax sp. PXF-14 TaxID=3230488 RepID=UPI00346545D4
MNTLPISSTGASGLASYPLAQPTDTSRLARASSNQAQATPQNSPLGQRVNHLGVATLDMAQQFLGSFAQQLFGDQAKGMKVSFDSFELSASSTASAAATLSKTSQGTDVAAAFRLEDSSSFTGHGTLTTADGQSFEFEIEVRYASVQEAAYAASQQRSLPAAGNAQQAAQPQTAGNTQQAALPQTSTQDSLRSQFAGTADDLLSQLSAEPVRQPFQLDLTQDNGNPLKLLGDLALKLLDLPGGPRHVDLPQVGKDDANGKKGLSVQA